jgi:hypothetical protein
MKLLRVLIVVMVVVFIAANSEARITSSENRGSPVRLHVLSDSVDLKRAESFPASLIGTILPAAPNFPVALVLLADSEKKAGPTCPPPPPPEPRSKSCPPQSPNSGGHPPNCGKGNGGNLP